MEPEFQYYSEKKEIVGACKVYVYVAGHNMGLLTHKVYHSPDGFQFGYGGSGPADLALSILFDYFSRMAEEDAEKLAFTYHQQFKSDFIAPAKKVLEINSSQIKEWLEKENEKKNQLKNE